MQINWSGLSSSVGGGEAVYSEIVLDMHSHAAKDVPHAGLRPNDMCIPFTNLHYNNDKLT